MIGCKLICFFGEVPPRQERTKKKPYAGGNRAGTACGVTDIKAIEKKPDKQTAGIRKALLNGCSVQGAGMQCLPGFKGAESLCQVKGETPCPVI
jgi:hypothetical protein